MSISFEIVVFLILVALAFDFLNGFHDAANSIATIVSTGAMSPHWAVAWAAFFNFIAFLVFGFAVATTIGKGIVDPAIVDHYVVFGALCGAISWNLITWYYGIPSSSSHALVGGIIGAGVAKAGVGKLVAGGMLKTAAAMGLGTLFGGWRIVKTMGMRITKLKPVGGFCASASGAMTLFLATGLGIPVSTTHTITGSIIGVGSARKLSAVRWGVAGNIVQAWIFTIPGSAFIAGVAWLLGTEYF